MRQLYLIEFGLCMMVLCLYNYICRCPILFGLLISFNVCWALGPFVSKVRIWTSNPFHFVSFIYLIEPLSHFVFNCLFVLIFRIKNDLYKKYHLVPCCAKCGFVLCHFVFNYVSCFERFVINYVSYFKYFVFNCDSYLNVVLFKIRLMSYSCLNIVHILMLFCIFN